MIQRRPAAAHGVVGGAGCPSRSVCASQARWDSALHQDKKRAEDSALHLRRSSTASGFTLLEMVAAIAIGAILLVTLAGVLNITVRGTVQMRGIMRQARLQSGVARILGRDLALAFKSGEKGLAFIGQSPDGNGLILEFTSQSSYDPGSAPPAGLVRVEYSLASSERFSGAAELRRREMPHIPGKPPDRSKAQPEPLADGVTDVSLAFYDGMRWEEQWRRDTLPPLIKLELRFAENAADPQLSPRIAYYFRPCVDPAAPALP